MGQLIVLFVRVRWQGRDRGKVGVVGMGYEDAGRKTKVGQDVEMWNRGGLMTSNLQA